MNLQRVMARGPRRLVPQIVFVTVAALLLWSSVCLAAETTNEVDQLRGQLQDLQKRFDQLENAHRREIDDLKKQLNALKGQQATEAERKKLEQELAAELAAPGTNAPAPAPATTPAPWSPAAPLQIGTARAYMDIGLVGTFAAGTSTASDIEGGTELGGHDPNQRGFTVQGVEANFTGAIDPYLRGNANVLFQVDSDGASHLELEEAWLETFTLPANLQLRAGQILTEFGRLNPTHPHTWGFVDSPLVLGRLLGPDGLRNPGARLSWLAPTPFYSELFLSIQDSQGNTATSFRAEPPGSTREPHTPFAYRLAQNDRGVQHFQDMLLVPRYAVSADLTDNQVLLAGISAAFGANSSGDPGAGERYTQIYGLDLTWKWKSPHHHAGFPFLRFQTEALLRRYEAGAFDWDLNANGLADPGEIVNTRTGLPAQLPGETLLDYGFYSELLYGFHKGWVAGLRLDYLTSDRAQYESLPLTLNGFALGRDPSRAPRWRLSPNLTWYPSEFSKIRLQYNYDDRDSIGVDHSIWLEFEFLLGAHGAHKF